MLTEAAFAEWLGRYEAAWEARDPAAAMAIFTPDGTYRETPFHEPMAGRDAIGEYWRTRVEASQAKVDFTSSVLAVAGDTGYARWRSRFDWLPSGRRIELEGIFRCRFTEGAALCFQLEEWWHERDLGPAVG